MGLETFDHGHHVWATAYFLMGAVERVCAWIDSVNGVIDDPATVMWKCRDGKRYGMCDYMFTEDMVIPSKYYSNDEWFEVTGSRGIILVNQGTSHLSDRPPVSVLADEKWTHYDDMGTDWSEGWIHSARNFVEAIEGKAAPKLTVDEGREVLRFALAIMTSAAKRREVYLDELDKPFPWLYNIRRRLRERKDCIVGRPRKAAGGKTAKYASQARALTAKLAERFDAKEAAGWTCTMGLHLTGEGGMSDLKYAVYVRNGSLDIEEGSLPEDPDLTLTLPAGVWAAILLDKKRIEMAVLQGKIKLEGQSELGLRVKRVFGM
mgnify:CR=1 FL=1